MSKAVNLKIVLENPLDNCKTPNGKLRVVINDTNADDIGESAALYDITWYSGADCLGVPVGTGETKSDLDAGSYCVRVKHKATGCENIDNKNIVDQSVNPPAPDVLKSDATCSVANSGSASVSIGGVTAGYKFEWSDGPTAKAVPDFTGIEYKNLVAGKYIVVATRLSTQCSSSKIIDIIKTTNPTVTASVIAHQTSCDSNKPNGSASALVGGSTVGYTFEWFFGQNTLLVNRVATANSAKGLKVGIYTVKATSISTGCSDTEEVMINFAVVTPTLLASSSNATQCNPDNGSVTASVSVGTATEYTFSWYKGNSVKTTPDFPDTVATLTGLPAGTYTVKARFRSRNCETAPIQATVINAAPVIALGAANVISLPSDCNDSGGAMSVTVSAPGNTLGLILSGERARNLFLIRRSLRCPIRRRHRPSIR